MAKGHLQTMNYFNPKTAAERYSKGRPDFHSNTIKHIKDYLHLDKKLNNALDIACETPTRDTLPPVLTTNGIIRMASFLNCNDLLNRLLR